MRDLFLLHLSSSGQADPKPSQDNAEVCPTNDLPSVVFRFVILHFLADEPCWGNWIVVKLLLSPPPSTPPSNVGVLSAPPSLPVGSPPCSHGVHQARALTTCFLVAMLSCPPAPRRWRNLYVVASRQDSARFLGRDGLALVSPLCPLRVNFTWFTGWHGLAFLQLHFYRFFNKQIFLKIMVIALVSTKCFFLKWVRSSRDDNRPPQILEVT